jgi:ABC-type transport system involved in cytochrome c biogenesis permease component
VSFLPIVERELRVTARRAGTYWTRFFLALLVLMIWFFLLVMGSGPVVQRGVMLFVAIGILAFGFCLLAGIFLTADCLSEEQREGTLGLLFLTELKGYDVVLGKLMATSLHAFYGLLAVLPVMALSLLMGGVTVGEFWRVTLVLIATLIFSLSTGMLVSAFNRDTRQAMTSTLLVILVLTGILPVIWWGQRGYGSGPKWDFLLWPGPGYLYTRAFDAYFVWGSGAKEFWRSLAVICSWSGVALIVASFHLAGAWREKGDAAAPAGKSGWRQRWRFGDTAFRLGRRQRLEDNPYCWLASRDRLTQRMAWGVLGPLLAIWCCFLAAWFSSNTNTKRMGFGVSMLMAFGLHQIFKCLVAIEASRRFSDDRRSGALELLLVTPLTHKQIISGQRRALKECFRGPMTLMLLINVLMLVALVINPLDMTGREQALFLSMYLGGAVALVLDVRALSQVGMWMALRRRRHHRAIFETLVRIMAPPWIAMLLGFFMAVGSRSMNTGELEVAWLFWFCFGFILDLVYIAGGNRCLETALREPANEATARPDISRLVSPAGLTFESR